MSYTPTEWNFNDPINEAEMDKLEQGVAAAASTADSALSNANTALTNAATAQSKADEAWADAADAQWDATNALANAAAAQSTANSALTKANIPGSVFFSAKRMAASTSLAANSFVTYPLDTIDENVGGGSYNTGTYIYTVPVTGRYLCLGSIRCTDSAVARNTAIGIGTANADGTHVAWRQFGGATRDVFQYTRIAKFNAGDLVRMYIYSTTSTFPTEYSGGIGNAQFMSLYLLG